MLLVASLAIGLPGSLSAQDGFVDREAKIKAAYLFQFNRYVKWPEDAFADTNTPIVIGAVGNDSVNDYLRVIAQKRTSDGRRLVFKLVASADEAKSCHILFISDTTNQAKIEAIVNRLLDAPVLLVGESPSFVDTGGVLAFVIVDNKVRLRLSMKSATDHQLRISSQLAKLAEVVN